MTYKVGDKVKVTKTADTYLYNMEDKEGYIIKIGDSFPDGPCYYIKFGLRTYNFYECELELRSQMPNYFKD